MSNKPKRVFKAGGVRAAIWENLIDRNGTQVPVHSVQITRTYKVGEKFKETSRFNASDLPKVQLVSAKAFEFLSLKEPDHGSEA